MPGAGMVRQIFLIQDMLWSALFHAYANGHNGVVKLLLEYGANEDLRDKVTACMLQHVVYILVIIVGWQMCGRRCSEENCA